MTAQSLWMQPIWIENQFFLCFVGICSYICLKINYHVSYVSIFSRYFPKLVSYICLLLIYIMLDIHWWINFFCFCVSIDWLCMKNHPPGARWMMMFMKELFLPICWIVKTQREQKYVIPAIWKVLIFLSQTFLSVMNLTCTVNRFLAILLSKRGKRKLVNGKSLYPR